MVTMRYEGDCPATNGARLTDSIMIYIKTAGFPVTHNLIYFVYGPGKWLHSEMLHVCGNPALTATPLSATTHALGK